MDMPGSGWGDAKRTNEPRVRQGLRLVYDRSHWPEREFLGDPLRVETNLRPYPL